MNAEEEVDALREEDIEAAISAYDSDELGTTYKIPENYETEEDPNVWHGFLPPEKEGGEAVYIEGILPNTVLTRQALQLVEKKYRKDPLIGLKEGQENLIRLCLRKIGDRTVGINDLRGRGLDKFLGAKQMHFVTEYFDKLTTPDEADVESFLSTVQTGTRRR